MMTVKEMMELLATMPPTAEVRICNKPLDVDLGISRVIWTKRMMSKDPDFVGVYAESGDPY